jgi:serine/threonine-protein kinase
MFGRYRLGGLLGRGGMGEVWRAADTSQADREVALKLVNPALCDDPAYTERFTRECELTAGLPYHRNIAPIYHYGEIDGRLYLTMPLVDGTDLATLIARDGQLAPERAVRIVTQVAAALAFAAAHGIVHRDVKPSNILVSSDADDHSHLIDFGVAFALDGTKLTMTSTFIGSPAYMAPERFLGESTQRGDIYALGCVLHEALTGSQAFSVANPFAYMNAHQHDPIPRPTAVRTELPPALDTVIARALAKDPADRYPSATEFARPPDTPSPRAGRAPPSRRRRPR